MTFSSRHANTRFKHNCHLDSFTRVLYNYSLPSHTGDGRKGGIENMKLSLSNCSCLHMYNTLEVCRMEEGGM